MPGKNSSYDSAISAQLAQLLAERKMVFLAGLPGTGKSLLIRELVRLAQGRGRTVHLLQWDVTRAAFETAKVLAKYPEIDGVTHAAIRKATGLWARKAVLRWFQKYCDREDIMLGELPLVGNRLIELVRKQDDAAEPILAAEKTLFVVPVPSREVRQAIEKAREQSITAPRHERELRDAQPQVLRMIWQDVAQLGVHLGLAQNKSDERWDYDPLVYAGVYQHLLRHRHSRILNVETDLRPQGSAYDVEIEGDELAATADEVDAIVAEIEARFPADELQALVTRWHEI